MNPKNKSITPIQAAKTVLYYICIRVHGLSSDFDTGRFHKVSEAYWIS